MNILFGTYFNLGLNTQNRLKNRYKKPKAWPVTHIEACYIVFNWNYSQVTLFHIYKIKFL